MAQVTRETGNFGVAPSGNTITTRITINRRTSAVTRGGSSGGGSGGSSSGGSGGSSKDAERKLADSLRAKYESLGFNTIQAVQMGNAEAADKFRPSNITSSRLNTVRDQIEKQLQDPPSPTLSAGFTQKDIQRVNDFGTKNLMSPDMFGVPTRAVGSAEGGGILISPSPGIERPIFTSAPDSFLRSINRDLRGTDKSGTVSPATFKQKVAMTPILGDYLKFSESVSRGFLLQPDPLKRDVRTLPGSELSGILLGTGLAAISTRGIPRVATAAKPLLTIQGLTSAGKVAGATVFSSIAADTTLRVLQGSEQRAAEKNPIFKDIFGVASGNVNEVIPLSRSTYKKKRFLSEVEQEAKSRGLTGKELADVLKAAENKAKRVSGVSIASLIGGGAVAERIGRNTFSRLASTNKDTLGKLTKNSIAKINIFQSSGSPTSSTLISQIEKEAKRQTTSLGKPLAVRVDKFKTGFKVIAPLGFGEGAGEGLSSQIIEGRKFDAKQVLLSGAIGAGTAGILGGAIVAARPKLVYNPAKSFKTGKDTYAFKSRNRQILISLGNILDPSELPGDLLATFSRRVSTLPPMVGKKASLAGSRSFGSNFFGKTSESLYAGSTPRTPVLTPSINQGSWLPSKPKDGFIGSFQRPKVVSGSSSMWWSPSKSGALSVTPSSPMVPSMPATFIPSISQTLVPSISTSVSISTTVPSISTSVSTSTTVPAISTTPATALTPSITLFPELFLFGIDKKSASSKQRGYMPQAKSKGKFVNVSPVALSEDDAKKRMAYVVDNTLSARGRVVRSTKKQSEPKKPQSMFFSMNLFTKKGNDYIEKNEFRINTEGEKKGLSVARLLATEKKKFKERGFTGFRL